MNREWKPEEALIQIPSLCQIRSLYIFLEQGNGKNTTEPCANLVKQTKLNTVMKQCGRLQIYILDSNHAVQLQICILGSCLAHGNEAVVSKIVLR